MCERETERKSVCARACEREKDCVCVTAVCQLEGYRLEAHVDILVYLYLLWRQREREKQG